VAEAIRTGPGQMPRFGSEVLTDGQVNAIVKYVQYLHEPESPGGLPLGYTGPVAEGFVALLVALGGLLLVARWITREPVAVVRPEHLERSEP
jgi:ubiquinol-cytochrome c reductase cytochrome c subunit